MTVIDFVELIGILVGAFAERLLIRHRFKSL